jgi:hypothetical protein
MKVEVIGESEDKITAAAVKKAKVRSERVLRQYSVIYRSPHATDLPVGSKCFRG